MSKYYRRIIFTKTPLKTQYNYNNVFQILPIDSKIAPTNPYAEDFPLFLEYFIDFEEKDKNDKLDILSELAIQQKKEFEIVNLLSALTNYRFFKYQTNKNCWAITTPNVGFDNITEEVKRIYNNQYSSWSITGYMYPGLKSELEIVGFTERKLPKMNLISPYYQYFTDNPVENKDGEISFPETISDCLYNYFSLSDKTLHKVKSCIYLACDGIDIANMKRSLGFLSFISAIEGLVGLEASDKEITFECKSCQTIKDSPYRCPQCNSPIWGIKTKFVEFLKKFVAGSEKSAQTYKEIYNFRSKITHKSQLFTGDYELSLEEEHLSIERTDWIMRLKTLQLFRLSLSNWLRYPEKQNK
jgi:hypothetical protein